ncbi:MAG: RNA polymerase sigma factor [Gemmatales bacterium]|nr:RNA polymerase sigma factor [Gemmatales bacterium]MDW7995624.1 RNA polymerase sigma factor [Gemmatales bacterium]
MAGPAQQPSAEEMLLTAFNRMRDELLSTLTLHLGNREDALDVAQEAFLKCWRNRREVLSVRNIRAWIYRIALNTARDNRRSGWYKRRRVLDDAYTDASACPPAQEQETEQHEFYQHLRRAIANLRPEEREVFLLRQNAELTYEEIAELRNVPVGTVKTQMRSALAKLREVLRAHAPCVQDCEEA